MKDRTADRSKRGAVDGRRPGRATQGAASMPDGSTSPSRAKIRLPAATPRKMDRLRKSPVR